MTNRKKLVVYKANQIVEAGYKLSLNEQRVVLSCIAQVNPNLPLLATDEFELSATDFAEFFDVSKDAAYLALVEVAETLFNRYVVVDNPYPAKPKIKSLKMRWISSIKHIPDEGKIILMFSQDMLPYLSELQGRFTKYELKYIGNMTSIYGIRLYELLMQWKTTGKREIEIAWLKKQFQLDENYNRINNLKARVIEPAVKDVNSHSDYQVAWAQRKTGRNVTHLTFTFGPKNSPEQAKKPKAKPTPKNQGPMLHGVPKLVIDKLARPGESYLDAATRILRDSLWP